MSAGCGERGAESGVKRLIYLQLASTSGQRRWRLEQAHLQT